MPNILSKNSTVDLLIQNLESKVKSATLLQVAKANISIPTMAEAEQGVELFAEYIDLANDQGFPQGIRFLLLKNIASQYNLHEEKREESQMVDLISHCLNSDSPDNIIDAIEDIRTKYPSLYIQNAFDLDRIKNLAFVASERSQEIEQAIPDALNTPEERTQPIHNRAISSRRKTNFPHKFIIAVAVILGTPILAQGSWLFYKKVNTDNIASQDRQAIQETIDKAKLIAAISVQEIKTIEDLNIARDKMRMATTDLVRLSGKESQATLNELTSKLNDSLAMIESKLVAEERFLGAISLASRMDREAASLVKDKSYTEEWKTARSKWTEAIKILSEIPRSSVYYASSKEGLVLIDRNLQDVNQVINQEDSAIKNLRSAAELAQKAIRITRNLKVLRLNDLQKAKTYWEQAKIFLAHVPSSSRLYPRAAEQLEKYANNYDEVSGAIASVRECVGENSKSEQYCMVSINLEIREVEEFNVLLAQAEKAAKTNEK
jgi:hypothetical protein